MCRGFHIHTYKFETCRSKCMFKLQTYKQLKKSLVGVGIFEYVRRKRDGVGGGENGGGEVLVLMRMFH